MISKYSVVETHSIGSNSTIHEFCVIRSGAVIGDNVVIHPNVVIERNVTISDDVEIFPGAYIGKLPKGAGNISRPVKYKSKLVIDRGCVIGPHAVIYCDVVIGESTLIGDGASIREGTRIGKLCILGRHVTVNYNTLIGNEVKIMDHCWLAGNMRIGNRVFISGGVMTTNDNDMNASGYNEEQIVGPRIHDGVRIGVGAILLPHITVAENAVIAAGAVVTKDVASYDLVMGIPARQVRNLKKAPSEMRAGKNRAT